jgi:hypothetical protein
VSANTFTPKKGNLQSGVSEWLARLALRLPAQIVPTALSPLKKHKHNGPVSAQTSAPRVLVHLLAERLLPNIFDCKTEIILSILAGAPLTDHEISLSTDVKVELAQYHTFTAHELAQLHLAPGDTKKRHGAFYTSSRLAERITTQILQALPEKSPVVDPACGGGVFLLAALDYFAAHEPSPSPLEWLTGRIYGVDINPEAVVLARLAVLLRARELAGRPLDPVTALTVAAQIRPGNTLVGELYNPEAANTARQNLLTAIRSGDFATTLQNWEGWQAKRAEQQTCLSHQISNLPIFNGADDGARLAQLAPFGWQTEFSEVFAAGGFGAVIGNPPYVGFNDYSGIEKAYFAHTYAPVYNLKSDMLYYFIQRGADLLRPGGRLGFVTSRFWKEATYAKPLRAWLLQNTRLLQIEDLGGQQFFEDAAVDVCLLYLAREHADNNTTFEFSYEGHTAQLRQSEIGTTPWTWLRRPNAHNLLLDKITERSRALGTFASCRTGVQTGLDSVFFVDGTQAAKFEAETVRRALKCADITPGRLSPRDLWLIVPPANFSTTKYPVVWEYLVSYRAELERRRRYDKPFEFYELQWAREPGIFEAPAKLVTPYKARRNTFALDTNGFWFSTDVISVVFPADWDKSALVFAQNFLNSSLSTFQFRSFGKPVSAGQWDYYANPVKKLMFPLSLTDTTKKPLASPDLTQTEIDEQVFALYELSGEEITLILNASDTY